MSQSDIHQTTYHLYRDHLGTGSSCDVYKGYHKESHEKVAIKVLKDHSWKKEIDKEVAALKQLRNHPNIVKFYGKERESLTNRPCLVMEYCPHGSLHSFLKEVENRHGLPDPEFTTLLDNLTNGLQHLHAHGCIHRDIKPGNILRGLASDGNIVYKLSDFGASRLSVDSEEFYSLAGTEEYLHPYMYEKAFINRRCGRTFDHTADMWSLGCTLYQAATGEMPYKPFGGARNDRSTMFMMISNKPPGTIAGYQYSADGDITWLRNLPSHCNMSNDLRTFVLPILVGLMGLEPRLQWTFDIYKKSVDRILKLKLVYVFDCEDIVIYRLYLDPLKSFAEFKDRVAHYTDISGDHQQLYYNELRLKHFLRENSTIADFPATQLNNAICVMSSEQTESNMSNRFSLEPYDNFHSMSSVNGDEIVAASQCKTIHSIHVKMQKSRAVILGLYSMTLALWAVQREKYNRLRKIFQQSNEILKQYLWFAGVMRTFVNEHLRNGEKAKSDRHFNVFKTYQKTIKDIAVKVELLYRSGILGDAPKVLDNDWLTLVGGQLEKGKAVLNRMQQKKRTVLTDYDSLEHQADKSKLQEITARCVFLWQNPCTNETKSATLAFSRVKKMHQIDMANMVLREDELTKFNDRTRQHFTKILEKITPQSRNGMTSGAGNQEISIRRSISQHETTSILTSILTNKMTDDKKKEITDNFKRFEDELKSLFEKPLLLLEVNFKPPDESMESGVCMKSS